MSTKVKCYIIQRKDYKIHTWLFTLLRAFFNLLKNVGVSPVTFLNWEDKCETLL